MSEVPLYSPTFKSALHLACRLFNSVIESNKEEEEGRGGTETGRRSDAGPSESESVRSTGTLVWGLGFRVWVV